MSGPFAPELVAFMEQERRLPRIGDDPPPWRYKGWLLHYVIEIDGLPEGSHRWDYYMRTLEAGRLLDEPIPQIVFGMPDNKVSGMIQEWSRLIGRDCGGYSDFSGLVDWLGWALGTRDDPPRFSDKVEEALYRQVNLGPLIVAPYDYFGSYADELKVGHGGSFFPTPHTVGECMARMTFDDGKDHRSESVCDPCVGTGRLLLHASNFSLNLSGNDINALVLAICKINGALYAPWMAFGMPEAILKSVTPETTKVVSEKTEAPILSSDVSGQLLLF